MSTGKMVALILGLCGGVGLLLIAICGGLLYWGYRNADASISPKIDAMFVAIANDQFADSYASETTPELNKIVTEEQFVALGKAIDLRLGKLESKTLRGFKMKQHNADSFMDVTYAAIFEKGNGTVTATLKNQDGDWKFAGFRVNSPVFEQDIASQKCPSCSQPHSSTAKFCPSCGAALSVVQEKTSNTR
jgi:hypothetical protein